MLKCDQFYKVAQKSHTAITSLFIETGAVRKTDVENMHPPDKGLLQLTIVQVFKMWGLDYRANFLDYIKQKQPMDLHFHDQFYYFPIFCCYLMPPSSFALSHLSISLSHSCKNTFVSGLVEFYSVMSLFSPLCFLPTVSFFCLTATTSCM